MAQKHIDPKLSERIDQLAWLGLTQEEAAGATGVGERTIRRVRAKLTDSSKPGRKAKRSSVRAWGFSVCEGSY